MPLVPRLRIDTPHGPLTVRAEAPDGTDEPFLRSLFATASDLDALPPAQRAFLLPMQFTGMRAGYASDYPAARWEVVSLNGRPVGNIVTHVVADHVLYVDIALLPATRRLGLATALMRALLEEPAALGLPARVKVMAHNAASLALCRRLGFTPRVELPPFVELEWTAPADRRAAGQARDGTWT